MMGKRRRVVGSKRSRRFHWLLRLVRRLLDVASQRSPTKQAGNRRPAALVPSVDLEIVQALRSLGYKRADAELAARGAKGTDFDTRLRHALRNAASARGLKFASETSQGRR